jgi:hypothetical protein
VWLVGAALAGGGTAEAERLLEEVRVAARRGQWAGVERAWADLVATGVPPPPEACRHAADAARQRGDLLQVVERLACAEPTAETLAERQELLASHSRVALFGRGPLEPEAMPFRPDAGRAIGLAREEALEARHFYGLLPPGRYTFGDVRLELAPAELTVVTPDSSATGSPSAAPSAGVFGGDWLGVRLSGRQIGDAVRADPLVGGSFRSGGDWMAIGAGLSVVGVAGAITGALLAPSPCPSTAIPLPELCPEVDPALSPVTIGVGSGFAALGVVAVGIGAGRRGAAVRRWEEGFE